jgi:prolipoprotein diacylglyceryltransferase
VPITVITLRFNPTVRVGAFDVRWETLGLAAALFVALIIAAAFVRASGREHGLSRLRMDDLFFLAMAGVPGAVVGGRAVLALAHFDYYRVHPGALVDPAQGSLSLLGAVLGGTLTAAYMCRLLEVPARRWLDTAAIPLLVAIGLGKLAYLLGGGGQGAPWDGRWAVAFAGPGPWLSALPAVPAYPSQVYEAAWALLGASVVLVLSVPRVHRWLPRRLRQADPGPGTAGGSVHETVPAAADQPAGESIPGALRFGSLWMAAVAWWLVGRLLVGSTWADPPVVAGLRAEQVDALAVLVVLVGAAAWWTRPHRPHEPVGTTASGTGRTAA